MTSLRERLPLRERMTHLGARWSGSGARGFLAWWGRSLAAWLPRAWRIAFGFDRGRLLLQPDGDALQLRLQQADDVRDLGRIPGLGEMASAAAAFDALLVPAVQDLPRWLLLPASSGLRRRLSLPAAAAERLRDVVGFEIDRQTPFTADAVAYDARVLDRRDPDGQIDAELIAVPRTTLDAQLAAIGDLAGTLAGIDVVAPDGAPLGVNLLAPAQRRQQADPWQGWNLALGLVCGVALAATLWQMLGNRRAAADAFELTTGRQVEAARQVSLQRQRLLDVVEGQAFLDRTRNGRPTAVEVVDELTRRLPDNTYLEKLAIEGDRITLIGLSSEASALVGRLEGSKLWRAPALTGALQPDPRTRRDRFTLVAELAVTAPTPEPADARAR